MSKILNFDKEKHFRDAARIVNDAETKAINKLSDTAELMESTLKSMRDCLGLFVEWNKTRVSVFNTYDIKLDSIKKKK